MRARQSLDEHAHAALPLRHLADDPDGACSLQIVEPGLIVVVFLKKKQHHAIAAERLVDRLDRYLAADAERRDRQRQDDGAAKGDDREFAGKRRSLSSLNHRRNLYKTRILKVCHKINRGMIEPRYAPDERRLVFGPTR